MILGNPEQRLQEAHDNYNTILELARRNQPERIEIKSIKLHNERLKDLLNQPPETLINVDYDRLRTLSIKYEQLVTEFQYGKSVKMSKGDFIARIKTILDIKDNGEYGSQIRSLDNRPPQHLSNGDSESSTGGDGKLKYGSKAGEVNMVRVPSIAGSSHNNLEAGNFGKKDSLLSREKKTHKNSYDMKDLVPPLIAPQFNSNSQINERINTEVSHIRIGNNKLQGSKQFSNDFPQPLTSYETLEPMKEQIQKMLPREQNYTPIADLNDMRQFPKPGNIGLNSYYFPPGAQEHSAKNNKSRHSGSIRHNDYHHQNNQNGMISDPDVFLTIGDESLNNYRTNIQNLFDKANTLKRDNSFKSQMRTSRDRSKQKPRSKFKSVRRIKDLSEKEDLIDQLAAQNLALKTQLRNNGEKITASQVKQQTYPTGTLEFQKYVISNELLKKENEEIYAKLKQLEEVLEELSRENYLFKGQTFSAPYGNRDGGEAQPNYHQNSPSQLYHPSDHSPVQQAVYEPNYESKPMVSAGSERRLPSLKHPLIELPPELGQLIDTQTHRSSPSPVVDYEHRQVYYHADYQGAAEVISAEYGSSGNKVRSQTHQNFYSSKSNGRQDINDFSVGKRREDVQSESPNFRRSNNKISQAYSERDFPQVNGKDRAQSQEYFDNPQYRSNSNLPHMERLQGNLNSINNHTIQDISDDKYFTANNISASGDQERLYAEREGKRNQFQQSRGGNNNSKQMNSSDKYQDFPRMPYNELSNQNVLSPAIQGQPSIEQSFDTFKILQNQSSNVNITPTNIIRNSVEKPDNLFNTNASTLLRNKVAFYKKSLVLVRDDPNFELAFKRSELTKELDTARIIFYVNNKRDHNQAVSFKYEYDHTLYTIKAGDKLSNVAPLSQGREELIVTINDNGQPSFIVCHLTVGTTSIDFVVPIFFFKFKTGLTPPIQVSQTLTINVDKQFSPQFLSTLIPLVHINPEQYLQFMKGDKPYHGESLLETSLGPTSLRLDWISGGLRITTHPKLIKAISWTLSDI